MTTTFDIDEIERLLAGQETSGAWWNEGCEIFYVNNSGKRCTLIYDEGGHGELDAALIVTLHNSAPAMIAELRELRAENARLREESAKAGEPHWFYAEGWEERCLHSPDEAIDLLDFPPGEYVTEVSTARPCPSIWCAVRVSDDEDADERFTFTEHETEADARAALGEPQ